MPDPISSSYLPPDLTCNRADSLTCEPPVAAPPPSAQSSRALCVPESESSLSDASAQLASNHLRADHTAFIAASAAPATEATFATLPTDNNTYRTSTHHDPGPYLDAGRTEDGGSVYAGAAFVKSHDHVGDTEVLSVSMQLGQQNELQAGVVRYATNGSLGGLNLSGNVEALTARANAGIHNDDGSRGVNMGALATGLGGEVSAEYHGWSLTAGLSVSLGAAISWGEQRDVDGDGSPERCFKMSLGPLTLGECDEP